MHSSTRARSTRSPNSLRVSKRNSSSRSMGGCLISRMRPPRKYLRSSIQNMGGVSGFSRVTVVSWALGWAGLADSSSFTFPCPVRMCSTTSSRVG